MSWGYGRCGPNCFHPDCDCKPEWHEQPIIEGPRHNGVEIMSYEIPEVFRATLPQIKHCRPAGSNADEWHLFLTEYCCNRPNQVNGMTYIAVQIAEAIETAERRAREPCGECHIQPGERCDICGKSAPLVLATHPR